MAATVLPRALERALADVGDVTVDRVVVELDVADHDDETLAVLWADAIRAGVLTAAPAASSGPGSQDPPRRSTTASARSHPDSVAAVRAWLAPDATARRRLPAALLTLGDLRTAAAVRDRLPAAEWAQVSRRLATLLGLSPHPPPPDDVGGSAPALPGPARLLDPVQPGTASPLPRPPEPVQPDATSPTRPLTSPAPEAATGPEPERDVLALLAALAELMEVDDGGLPLDGLTRAAGLVLLYPWLGDHCRRAEDLHPGLDPLDVREAALGAVVDPDDPVAADDPLVRLLAGRPDPLEPARRTRVPLPALPEVAASAATVLASFAAQLPGFERSTESFVRHSWITRLGVLDNDRDPPLLTAAAHPLDVLLPLLPYPVGLLKLPWSPPLTVRFR
ncbi:contractile injection system tape measure protein [Kocuria sabuli]|uniref:contractile injection system tape measure protein n=1 Tax=Kocuria sabuli TaxID=3071448 RepID=UPI0034D65620